MKISCHIRGKAALIVGYTQGRRGKVQAIVISEGKLRSISLKEVELSNIPAGLEAPRGAEVIHIARN